MLHEIEGSIRVLSGPEKIQGRTGNVSSENGNRETKRPGDKTEGTKLKTT